ncbi:helix-turn-helix transcriptional regulator [Streptomyces montanus]|uniref:Helix-turn-helix transcriptional regulator n=1 Tax=Streptomyces montanus TaxID=2580423 RepID=A0A5R9FQB3_9ACTN|nr:helix-turn-helix transcriptional regulator [Streptomyces montanus]TLS46117.1 helix-turn-helix transcriptional regulator [Streptomyces montanus]
MGESTPEGQRSIAERLDWLIREVYPGQRDIERKIAQLSQEYEAKHPGVPTITHQTVANIRSGKSTNPGINAVRALANAFGVKVSYFLDDQPAASPTDEPATMAQPVAPTLDQRLNLLFEVVHPKGRDAFTNNEVAEVIAERGGKVTAEEIKALREGTWDPSDYEGFGALADFFRVPVTYFTDGEAAIKIAAGLNRLSALKAFGVRTIVMRLVNEIDPEALEAVVPLMERLARTERRQRM